MPQINESAIEQALTELETGQLPSFRAAERLYGLSRRTLGRRAFGGDTRREAHSTQQLLSPVQEEWLVQWILDLEQTGFAPTHAEARDMALKISQASGGPGHVGKHWLNRFLARHPHIRSKVGRKIDNLRVKNTNPEELQKWFTMVEALFTRYRFQPEDIYNMDETGCSLGVQNNQMVLGSSHTKRVHKKSPEVREWVSLIKCICADGSVLQPLAIFKGQNCQSTWFEDDYIPNWRFTTLKKAWTSNFIGLHWLLDIFLPQTQKSGRSRLLLVDGHESHASVDFMWECRQANVVLVYLKSHTSHVCQPLDLSCFSICKSKYRQGVGELA